MKTLIFSLSLIVLFIAALMLMPQPASAASSWVCASGSKVHIQASVPSGAYAIRIDGRRARSIGRNLWSVSKTVGRAKVKRLLKRNSYYRARVTYKYQRKTYRTSVRNKVSKYCA